VVMSSGVCKCMLVEQRGAQISAGDPNLCARSARLFRAVEIR
jgi:hypothetical protein